MFHKRVLLRLIQSSRLWIPKLWWIFSLPFLKNMHRQVPKCPGRREKWLNYKKLFNFYFSYLFNIVSWIDAGSFLAKFLIFYSYNRIALNDIIFENLKYWISYECFCIQALKTLPHNFIVKKIHLEMKRFCNFQWITIYW